MNKIYMITKRVSNCKKKIVFDITNFSKFCGRFVLSDFDYRKCFINRYRYLSRIATPFFFIKHYFRPITSYYYPMMGVIF